jgi:hypothetical protein
MSMSVHLIHFQYNELKQGDVVSLLGVLSSGISHRESNEEKIKLNGLCQVILQ